ncbi:serine hydrolase [Tenacibaculum sp. 190524A02b]|uniref:serine hydrolase n=1 Tax=Tenacibaculum vairaonense TaxID=3137860 RepID=UPI0031FB4F00
MLRKLFILIPILGILIAIISFQSNSQKENIVLEFIKKHPQRSAIKIVRNKDIIANVNSNKIMPLASTVKIIIAIEYAIQAANSLINPDEKIHISELEKFHVKNTDGGSHSKWLEKSKSKIINNKISIREITKGMIRYSSNANTEWLCHRLGLKNINRRLKELGIQKHTEIYYMVSSLFVGKELFPNTIGTKLKNKLKNLPLKKYINATHSIHNKLLLDSTYKKNKGDLRINIQKVRSDNLPSSTVSEYTELMNKLNSKSYLSKKTHSYLDEALESLMKNPKNQKWLQHAGTKGGSTAFVFTNTFYATDKKGNTTEVVYFFNNLTPSERKELTKTHNAFILKILTNKEFRAKISNELSSIN